MNSYVHHLHRVYNPKTFQRKCAYLSYNFKALRKLNQKSEVLEIGPGMGELEHVLNARGITHIDVIDNDEGVLKHIDRKFKTRKQIRSTNLVQTLSRVHSQYDLIVLCQVLEHLPIEQHEAILKELFRVLKPGGTCYIVVPNAGNPLNLVERYGDLQHTTAFTEFSLLDLVYESVGNRQYLVEVLDYRIPPSDLLNLIRILMQFVLHKIVLLILIVNGGSFSRKLAPNILLTISKERNFTVLKI